MDGITIDDLKTVFGNTLIDLEAGQEKQGELLHSIQELAGEKFKSIDDHLEKLDKIAIDLYKLLSGEISIKGADRQNSFFHKLKDTPSSKPGNRQKQASESGGMLKAITGNIASVLSSAIKPSAVKPKADKGLEAAGTPFVREVVDIEFTPKTKIMLEDILDYELTSLYHKFVPHLEHITDLLKKVFDRLEIKTGDKKGGWWGLLLIAVGEVITWITSKIKNIKLAVSELAELFKTKWTVVKDFLKGTFEGAIDFLKERWLKVREFFTSDEEALIKEAEQIFNNADKYLSEFGETVKGEFGEIVETSKSGLGKVWEFFTSTWGKITDAFGETFAFLSRSWAGFSETFTAITESALKGIQSIFTGIGRVVDGIAGAIGSVFKAIGSAFETFIGLIFKIPLLGPALKGLGKLLSLPVLAAIEAGSNTYQSYKELKDRKDISTGQKFFIGGTAVLGTGIDLGLGAVAGGADIYNLATGTKAENNIVNKTLKSTGLEKGAGGMLRDRATETVETANSSNSFLGDIAVGLGLKAPKQYIQPKAKPMAANTKAADDKTHQTLDAVKDGLAEQNALMKEMLGYHKQSVNNTEDLNNSMLKLSENSGKTINMTSVNNTTPFINPSVGNMQFRSTAFAR